MTTITGPVNFSHPANARVLAYLKTRSPEASPSLSPDEVDTWTIGTHPDLVEYFWGAMAGQLPEPCRWVVYGRPALVHPRSGAIFGIASGTSTVALRLPGEEREAAFAVPRYGRTYQYPSSVIHAEDIGDDWALIRPFGGPTIVEWCLKAYIYAGSLDQATPSTLDARI